MYRGLLLVVTLIISSRLVAEPIHFCRPNNMVSAHAYIAEQQGYFKKRGVEVVFDIATNAKICQDMLLSNKANVMVGADGPFAVAAPHNPPFRIVANLGSNPETAIFARKDRGITSFADLRGKRIGYLPGTVSYFFLGRVLKAHGIKKEEVVLISLQPPALSQALIGGTVDAIAIWEPWGYNAQKELGDLFIRLEAPQLYQYQSFLIVRQQEAQSEHVEKILAALIDAEDYIKTHSKEAQQYLSAEIKLDISILKGLWDQYVFDVSLKLLSLKIIEENFALLQDADENFHELSLGDLRRFVDSTVLKKIDARRIADS